MKLSPTTLARYTPPEPLATIELCLNVHAEAVARASDIPAKQVRSSDIFAVENAKAKASFANWTRQQRAKAKAHPVIMAEHAKLPGESVSLDDLFAAPDQEAEAEAA